jgi:aconitate hydratase
VTNRPITEADAAPGYDEKGNFEDTLEHGSVVIAAITSCTNTSNPSVMIAAGLVAKKAVEKGLQVSPKVKTSLAPGSRVVTDYLEKSGLQTYLDQLGFELVAYGCTTCIGNSGPLDEQIENSIKEHDIITASVLSGNRNFEARIHGSVKANFLMSPPLVVAYALAGNVNVDLTKDPIGKDKNGKAVYLKDIWPTSKEVQSTIEKSLDSAMFTKRYSNIMEDNPVWKEIHGKKGARYEWDKKSTYIQKPPYLEGFTEEIPKVKTFSDMRPLALFGDSVTTDHISPAGAFKANTPAGKYLIEHGVDEKHFNSYGSRRGNHLVMMRGTFANVRIRNMMADGKEGGFTKIMPEGTLTTIFEASEAYAKKKIPLIVFAGKDYGMGSSRDWAAKGPALLGVRVVVATSFERIHRSNLIGMGILPLEFENGQTWESLGINGSETFNLLGLEKGLKPRQKVTLEINRNGKKEQVTLMSRLDTPIEVQYYVNGGIMPFMLRQ